MPDEGNLALRHSFTQDADEDREADALRQRTACGRGVARARSHCGFVLLFTRFVPYSLTYSLPLFLKRQYDRALGVAACLCGCCTRASAVSVEARRSRDESLLPYENSDPDASQQPGPAVDGSPRLTAAVARAEAGEAVEAEPVPAE